MKKLLLILPFLIPTSLLSNPPVFHIYNYFFDDLPQNASFTLIIHDNTKNLEFETDPSLDGISPSYIAGPHQNIRIYENLSRDQLSQPFLWAKDILAKADRTLLKKTKNDGTKQEFKAIVSVCNQACLSRSNLNWYFSLPKSFFSKTNGIIQFFFQDKEIERPGFHDEF